MRLSSAAKATDRVSKMRIAVMLSGCGTNAEKIIEFNSKNYIVSLLFSDNPDSNCKKISEKFKIPCEIVDIENFYLNTPKSDMKRRSEYDSLISDIFRKNKIDLVALAGYRWVITSALYENFTVLNIHPGDLRVIDKNGLRKYRGLGWVPVAKALLNKEKELYSTVHFVNGELDGGKIACISKPVKIDIDDAIFNQISEGPGIKTIKMMLKNNNPYVEDVLLYKLSLKNLEKLKQEGDWKVFPVCIDKVCRKKGKKDIEEMMNDE